jgi:hypothetical protein
MGFLVDQRHVMTCAHVIGQALGDDKTDARARGIAPATTETVRLDFIVRPVTKREDTYEAEVVAAAWRPKGGRDEPADVAVLRILGDAPLPPKSLPVWTYTESCVGDGFRAFGITRVLPDGTNTQGKIIGDVSADRIEVFADDAEVAITNGFSGTAVWNGEGLGVVGMVVEAVGAKKGLFIPITSLDSVWPGLVKQQDRTSTASVSAPARPLGLRLADDLHTFDRQRQTTAFEKAIEDFWGKKRSPVICAIEGIADDLPMLFRDRCTKLTLRNLLGDNDPQLLKIDWSNPAAWGGVPEALAILKHQVKSELKAIDASPAEIRTRYNKDAIPWAFFSFLKEAELTLLHKNLLREWIAFWREVGDQALSTPLAVLLIFERESSPPSTFLDELFKEFGEGHFDCVRPIPKLHDFPPFEVVDWFIARKKVLNISDLDLNDKLVPAARGLKDNPMLRLRTLETWLQSLPM